MSQYAEAARLLQEMVVRRMDREVVAADRPLRAVAEECGMTPAEFVACYVAAKQDQKEKAR